MKTSKVLQTGLVLVSVLLLASCTAGSNPAVGTPAADGQVADFVTGLWQGTIAGFAFILSLFNNNVHIYEVHNNGGWYDFGFLIGVGAFASSAKKRITKERVIDSHTKRVISERTIETNE